METHRLREAWTDSEKTTGIGARSLSPFFR
jgi:hypothetical protein